MTTNGLKDATTDEFQIAMWATDHPDANLAISTEGLLVVDRDVNKETGAENNWLENDPCLMDLMQGPVSLTPRGGDHSWFQQPVGRDYRNSVSQIGEGVDIRANGGYVLVYPSVVDGKPYRWLDTNQLDCPAEKLPTPPEWLLRLIDQKTKVKPSVAQESTETVGEGGRQASLVRAAGALRRSGFTESEIYAALVVRNQTRCSPPLPDHEVRQTAESVAKYEPDQITEMLIDGVEPEKPVEDPGHFPKHLLNVPGFMRAYIDYTLKGAVRPQPEATLAAAIALQGVIAGRKVQGATGLRTNVMTIALCGTGGGKERPRQTIKESLFAASMADYVPVEELSSATALRNVVANHQACLLLIDEMGKFLRTTKDYATNPHVANIIGLLMKLFSQANQVYLGMGFADTEKRKPIVNPHVCLFGTSVRQSVLESFTAENLTDGFVSRLLIFESSDDNPEAVRRPCIDPPPESLIKQLEWWNGYNPTKQLGTGNMSPVVPDPRIIADGPGVEDAFFEADKRFRSYQDPDQVGSAIWTRANEKARSLALIWQCSADCRSDSVTMDAAVWALEVVEHLTRRIILLANDWVADNRQGRLVNKITRKMREKGGELPLWGINRLLQKDATTREVRDLLETLRASGTIELVETKTSGRTSATYKLTAL